MIRELIVGAVGMVVLAAVFLLVVRQPTRPPGACAGCALAGSCERQGAAGSDDRGATDRQTCYVSGEPEDHEGPPT